LHVASIDTALTEYDASNARLLYKLGTFYFSNNVLHTNIAYDVAKVDDLTLYGNAYNLVTMQLQDYKIGSCDLGATDAQVLVVQATISQVLAMTINVSGIADTDTLIVKLGNAISGGTNWVQTFTLTGNGMHMIESNADYNRLGIWTVTAENELNIDAYNATYFANAMKKQQRLLAVEAAISSINSTLTANANTLSGLTNAIALINQTLSAQDTRIAALEHK
jgi:hypothetical protein